MNYFISDTHFGDKRVFDKCSRPFKDVNECAEFIVDRWNDKVKGDDHVYILGDIAEDSYVDGIDILKRLKGHKHFIVGNHDEKMLPLYKKSGVFESIDFIKLITDSGRKVCLRHYPLMDWMEFNRQGM